MFKSKQAFTVSIGSNGAVIVLHNGKNIKQKILVSSLNDENKTELEKLFKNNKNSPIYILLDTADQNYKKRTYPAVKKSDLPNLIDRDLKKEVAGDDKALKGSINNFDVKNKKWESVLVFSHCSTEVNLWIDFLLQMPGKVMGIYMLPAETNLLSKMILGKQKGTGNNYSITFFIIQNKVSGIRQIIFSGDTVIFTRLANYQFDDPKFCEEFEHDIFRTNEYLKRMFPDLKVEDVNIINILPEEVLKKVGEIKNSKLTFTNYTPYNAAVKVGLPNILAQNSHFSDILVSNVFINSKKKTLKFSNPEIDQISKLYLAINAFSGLNIFGLVAILICVLNVFIYSHIIDNKISKIMTEKNGFERIYKQVKSKAFDNEEDDTKSLPVDELMDFGKLNEILGKNNLDIFEIFKKLKLISNYSAIIKSFSYNLPNFDPKANSPTIHPAFSIAGSIQTPSGDVEDVFKQYDGLALATKNSFTNYDILFSELPKDIDFSKKYYSSSFDLIMTGR